MRDALTAPLILAGLQIAFALVVAALHLHTQDWSGAIVVLATLLLNDLFLLVGLWIVYRQQINALRHQLLDLIAEVKHDHIPTPRQ